MLIVMAGLPGSGKSAVAAELARRLPCTVLAVDPIEAAMWRAGVARDQPTGLAAYVVAEDLAREQLALGGDVVIDAVNDAPEARAQWIALAEATGATLVWLEVFCGDPAEHRRRLESRVRGIPGFPEPSWRSTQARAAAFEHWNAERLRLDSRRPLGDLVDDALAHLALVR